jgi:2,3-dihydroxyphenylpropionate 1,2-dioxygenase
MSTMQLVCTSHSPLLLSVTPQAKQLAEGFFAAVEEVHRDVIAYDPELVVLFAPDHFNGFFYDVMPSFCVGFEGIGCTDWAIESGSLNVPGDIAGHLAAAVRDEGIDLAISRRMRVDHGFTIPLNLLTKRLDAFPTIPIFINCNAPPLPSCRRTRLLGESVGRFLQKTGKRVLIVGSGGLSHDPPHRPYERATPELRRYLHRERAWTPDQELARQERVKKAARELVDGGGPCLPPNREWDRGFLNILTRQDLRGTDDFSDDWIQHNGGSGGQEVRTWIAAFAALGAAGEYRARERYYEIVPDWITGMAVLQAAV